MREFWDIAMELGGFSLAYLGAITVAIFIETSFLGTGVGVFALLIGLRLFVLGMIRQYGGNRRES